MPSARRSVATTLLALALAGPAAVAVVPSAGAAAPTCLGREATIVGDASDEVVTGTEGDDVIVADSGDTLEALGGDDLVCTLEFRSVDAGDGDDRVQVSGYASDVQLGAGSDELTTVDTPGHETNVIHAWTGTGSLSTDPVDDDPDTVDLRGARLGAVRAGEHGRPFDDVIRVGPGHYVTLYGTTMTAEAEVSGDRSRLVRYGPGDTEAWTVSLGGGTASGDAGSTFRWSGFPSVGWYDTGSVVATGTSGDDVINGPVISASLGRGDDRAVVYPAATTVPGARIDGGPGRDSLDYQGSEADEADAHDVSISVASGTARFTSPEGEAATTRFAGFETHSATSYAVVRMVGGPGPDRLFGSGCDIAISGGAGADRIDNQQYFDADDGPAVTCSLTPLRAALSGGPGNDRMNSGGGLIRRAERIAGGAGDDTILAYRPGVVAVGEEGDDRIGMAISSREWRGVIASGGPGNDRLDGGRGPDALAGGPGRDVLLGDGGRDVGNGGSGVDRCVAVERRTSCERR